MKVETAKWLERLPLAPEFRPTDTEFADPIAYISKIEKEASAFGICKVIPPLPKPSRKYVLNNLNKSLSKCPELGTDINRVVSSKTESVSGENCNRSVNDVESRAVFTTRSQELGCVKAKKTKGVTKDQVPGAQKHVWQSGEVYTLEQFEAKSKIFAKSQLGMVKEVNPLVIETMFWKAASEKPIYVEYANDVPGSGFGQPEGLLHHFHKRRRRRKRNSFDRNNSSSASSKKDNVGTVTSSSKDDKDSGQKYNPYFCTETASSSLSPARNDSNPSIEAEGSAGWKLSNSPWNLQVIARSPGSLTKFMPDDIPGVTSPMVYVGMLFSWFAWHVEDHELHSLNYLHIGSPKTWYSVPGDRAFDFEETIHHHAYGGATDRSVSLLLLGEKTTVLSPEVVVASGIPCCRLVQNHGEFVVTFPRAYHIGFSHGFNCGEAANFATPNWLTVAKEAAVRRAAMNFLPMLSHQQLLSLLTMSFISRIPRSLLPGVQSSRLRDRQKEEREFLVKRAFIEDILHENNLLAALIKRSSSYRSVLWDAESLPSSIKASESCDSADVSVLTSNKTGSSENDDSVDHVCQLDEYNGAVGFDLNDDDLAYDFQMDSGTLPCVACGILGFPFMAVLQPSQAASKNLLHENPLTVSESFIEEIGQSPASDHCLSAENGSGFPDVEIAKDWNVSNLFLKPRIFCLKHALEIEQLLRPIGGANVLVICHSDFQKIKAHVASIAEETSIPFHFNEIPLTNASQEDLHLIDIAIDRDEQVNRADWTGQLNVNLQHYLKVKRSSPTKNVQYALTLLGLFCDGTTPMPDASSVKWSSRKLRSNRHLKHLSERKPYVGFESIKKFPETNLGREVAEKDIKIIQYSRKIYKSVKSAGREAITYTNDDACKDLDTKDKRLSEFDVTNGSNEEAQKNSGSPSHENVRGNSAESQTLTEGETVDNDEIEMLCSVQHDGDDATKEVSGPICPSNSSNDNPQSTSEEMSSERSTSVINESFSDLIEESSNDDGRNGTLLKDKESGDKKSMRPKSGPVSKTGSKRKREVIPPTENQIHAVNFVKSPCEGLRPRGKIVNETPMKKLRNTSVPKKGHKRGRYKCDLDGCSMSFQSKTELVLHKGNRCPVEGCRKKFSSHKYTIQHHRVHDDDRPLKCTWNGCTMSFKWAWARTEHLRVHTGERPYACKVKGCGLTFRFISDSSRHRRKTGHCVTTVA